MFVDLHRAVRFLSAQDREGRLEELAKKLPPAAIYAVGGFPILHSYKESEDEFLDLRWVGQPLDKIKSSIKDGLGISADLTYLNPKSKTLDELGDVCVDKKHTWAYHWMSVSIVLANFPLVVEMAFAHDTRFKMSWVVQKNPTGKVVGITGSIKDWLDYTKHEDDLSFDEHTRSAMHQCRQLIQKILP